MSPQAPFVSRDEAASLLAAARGGRVAVIGDAMLDAYLTGTVERVSPEAPVPVVRVEREHLAPGGAANVALGVAALGARCRLVAAVGDDDAGRELAGRLEEAGVSADHLVRVEGRPTTRKTRIVARHQQMLRVDREDPSPLAGDAGRRLEQEALEAVEWADVLVIEDYDKGVITSGLSRSILDRSAARDIPSVVDPKLRHFFDFRGVTVFKPNARELAAALGLEREPRDESALRPLLGRLGCECLLLTLGEEGMLLVGPTGQPEWLAPHAREVFDVTGAGDTVTAVVATGLMAGASFGQAAYIANLAAGIEVTRLGAVPVSAEDLLTELRRRDADAQRDSRRNTQGADSGS